MMHMILRCVIRHDSVPIGMPVHTRIRIATTLFILFGLLFGVKPLWAASLWNDRSGSLYSSERQWQVNDLITVLIVEQAQATQTAGTETSRKSGADVGVTLPLGVVPLLDAGAEAGIYGGDSLRSTGKTVRGGSLQARVTAQVTDVLSNGNLMIEGRQSIVLNGEAQEIVISGMVRPQDIASDNTVLSGYIADAQITYKGAGTLGDKQQQGILTRFWHWLF
jgi:flagellar L-ring protein precursor FlgH